MQEINEPIPSSVIATSMEECYDFVEEGRLPGNHPVRRIRWAVPAAASAENKKELEQLCYKGMENSAHRTDPAGKISSGLEGNRIRGYPTTAR